MSEPILLLGIGNTSVSLGAAVGGRLVRRARINLSGSDGRGIAGALRALRMPRISRCVLCSVVPAAEKPWLKALEKAGCGSVLRIDHSLDLGFKFRYPRPETVGADRLADVAAVAAAGKPAIVADFGTATTFNVLLAGGYFAGGAIAPGWPLCAGYLHEKTALLPEIAMDGGTGRIGRSTGESMRLGCIVGYGGLVEAVVRRLRETAGANCRLVATGGYAREALRECRLKFRVDGDLTFKGMLRIDSLNRAAGGDR